jgi:hypothetical protein
MSDQLATERDSASNAAIQGNPSQLVEKSC